MMKKLFSVLMALCLLCTTASALAEETPTWEKMPQVVTVDEGVELTDADFEGDWIADKGFYGTDYLTPEEVEAKGLAIRPVRIAGGKVINIVTDEAGEHEVSAEYTLENNQILFTDEEGIEAVFEKLEDGNLVLSLFVPAEGDTPVCVTYFMVHPET